MRYIKRVSKVKNDDTKGYIINSTNVVDKEKNTYSANVIDNLLGSQGWKSATINTNYFSNGIIRYTQIGKLVIVQILDLKISVSINATELPLITGLPKAKDFTAFIIQGTDGDNDHLLRMVLSQGDTVIKSWYHNKGANPYVMYYGMFCYFTE